MQRGNQWDPVTEEASDGFAAWCLRWIRKLAVVIVVVDNDDVAIVVIVVEIVNIVLLRF